MCPWRRLQVPQKFTVADVGLGVWFLIPRVIPWKDYVSSGRVRKPYSGMDLENYGAFWLSFPPLPKSRFTLTVSELESFIMTNSRPLKSPEKAKWLGKCKSCSVLHWKHHFRSSWKWLLRKTISNLTHFYHRNLGFVATCSGQARYTTSNPPTNQPTNQKAKGGVLRRALGIFPC